MSGPLRRDAPRPSALGHLRVVDLSSGVAGQYCGKLLAGYGAQVTLVEPVEGTPTRRMHPFTDGGCAGSPTSSLTFRHLNQGKASVVVPDKEPARGNRLCTLTAGADVVIRDAATVLPPLGPAVVECVVSDFPDGGPYADWAADEMVHQALSGYMNATGRSDREPLYGVGRRAYYACGTTAFVSVLAALHERHRSGRGQRVRASVFESMAAMGQNFVTQYSYNGTTETRARYTGLLATLRCADGYIVMFAIRDPAAVCRLFDAEHLAEDPRFDRPGSFIRNWDELVKVFQDRALRMTTEEVVTRAQELRISCERIWAPEELVASEQWLGRGVVRTLRSPCTGREEAALGPVFRISGSPYLADTPSPLPGEAVQDAGAPASAEPQTTGPKTTGPKITGPQTTGRLSAEPQTTGTRTAVPQPAAARTAPKPAGEGPLAGIRVIDMTTAWAGPMATRSLAWLGAEVIKIEPPRRPDGWRGFLTGGPPHHYPDMDPGDKPYNRNLLFNTQGHDKLSLSLDLKRPGGLDVIRRLAAVSDVLVANFTPGVLDRLGIGHDDLAAINDRIVVVEMPAFGATGPMASHQGMGKTMEAACGMAALLGYGGDEEPVLTGPAILDPIGGLNAAAAVVTALELRARHGAGCHVEVPQTEAAAHWIGEYVLQQVETGRVPAPDGNHVPDAAPHQAFPAAGDDQWVAVAVRGDAEWRTLCRVIDRPDLAADGRFATLGGRLAHQAELEDAVAAWTRTRGKREAARALQAAGVPAAPVNDGTDVATDPGLRACGFLTTVTHPEAGTHVYPGLGFRLDRTPGAVRRPAPLFGQHNREVLAGLLGLTDTEIADLYAHGTVTDDPVLDDPPRRGPRKVRR
ncbi:CoA transferase [Actinomadura sp. NBRC 104412]|uniref:CaiB/BaiF CoA-transferase family protein n=1 Tax=Actinomadura sp. NBRC 104412 TaxID=3032203 RepID=UPI0024A1809A|nr:CoA transferase [Actinomadura sp. NBRC 104412]GLZ09219.1 CoA transferase [Actinomadura sp. NBRC 104412]